MALDRSVTVYSHMRELNALRIRVFHISCVQATPSFLCRSLVYVKFVFARMYVPIFHLEQRGGRGLFDSEVHQPLLSEL